MPRRVRATAVTRNRRKVVWKYEETRNAMKPTKSKIFASVSLILFLPASFKTISIIKRLAIQSWENISKNKLTLRSFRYTILTILAFFGSNVINIIIFFLFISAVLIRSSIDIWRSLQRVNFCIFKLLHYILYFLCVCYNRNFIYSIQKLNNNKQTFLI